MTLSADAGSMLAEEEPQTCFKTWIVNVDVCGVFSDFLMPFGFVDPCRYYFVCTSPQAGGWVRVGSMSFMLYMVSYCVCIIFI